MLVGRIPLSKQKEIKTFIPGEDGGGEGRQVFTFFLVNTPTDAHPRTNRYRTELIVQCATFGLCKSDVCLYVSVTRQDVAVGAALGLARRLRRQHVGSGRHFFGLSPLQPAMDQGHGGEHQTAHEGRDPSQGEGHCVVPKVITE